MSEETTGTTSMTNFSSIFNNNSNTSFFGGSNNNNSSNDTTTNSTGTQNDNGLNLAMFALPQIPSWVSSLYLSMLCLSILIGVPGNALTVAAYARIRAKTNCDWYILVVALTDLVSCLFRSPVYIMEYHGVWLRYSNSDVCRFISWMSQTTVCVSIFMFALIAIDRYIKLCQTFKWNISPTRARNIILIMIAINLLIAAPCLFIFENLPRGVCNVKTAWQETKLVKGYYTLIFALFLVMFIAVVFCYINIAIKVQNTRRVGDVSVGPANMSCAKTADDDELTGNTQQDTSFKPVAGSTVSEVQTENPPCASTNLTLTQHLTLPDRDRPGRKMTTTLASSYEHSPVQHNSLKPPALAADETPVFILGGEELGASNGDQLMKKQHQMLHQDSSVGGNFHTNSFVTSDMSGRTSSTIQMRQGGASAKTALSEMNRRKAVVRQQRNIRITGLLFVVTAVFILSWVPPYISMVKGFYIGYSFPFSLGEWILLSYGRSCYVINTFSNPIIYAALSATYRRHVVGLAKALWKALRNMRCRR